MSWKETLATAYTTIPKNFREFAWRFGVATVTITSILTGFILWRDPSVVLGLPVNRQSLIERIANDKSLQPALRELMQEYFYEHRPHGLMLVAWEEVNVMVGIWVRPANRFPGKSGVHDLTPDMRTLGGPFLFGECAYTESIAMPGKIMVACPVSSSYDVWGYVAAVVDDNPEEITRTLRLLGFLANRVTNLVY